MCDTGMFNFGMVTDSYVVTSYMKLNKWQPNMCVCVCLCALLLLYCVSSIVTIYYYYM